MIGLKDLPDGALGAIGAGALWLSACYVFLAPRAMAKHFETEVHPPCLEMLEQEQDRAITQAEDRAKRKRDDQLRDLREDERQLRALEQLSRTFENSGTNQLFRGLGVEPPMNSEEIEALRARVDQLRAAISQLPDFSQFRADHGDLLKTCSCAAFEAAAGKRMSYAVSLASFRLISPAELTDLRSDVSRIAGSNSCGAQPWRNLS
ncbi:MAG: hypothetical protein QNI84_12170 [Henriciella sp.]|nr:hypothetical protein [Henriciella sp.]